MALDFYIREGGARVLSAGILLGVAGLVLAAAAVMWAREPEPWRHRFVLQRFSDGNFDRLAAALGRDAPPGLPVILPERVLSATWVREALVERLVAGAGLNPSELAGALENPLEAPVLGDRPAVRRFLDETRDLGVARKGTVLTLQRRDFLKTANEALKEAGSL